MNLLLGTHSPPEGQKSGARCRTTPISHAVRRQPRKGQLFLKAVFQTSPLTTSLPLTLKTQQRTATPRHRWPPSAPPTGHPPTAVPGGAMSAAGQRCRRHASETPLGLKGEDAPRRPGDLHQPKGAGSPGDGGRRPWGWRRWDGERNERGRCSPSDPLGFLLETAPRHRVPVEGSERDPRAIQEQKMQQCGCSREGPSGRGGMVAGGMMGGGKANGRAKGAAWRGSKERVKALGQEAGRRRPRGLGDRSSALGGPPAGTSWNPGPGCVSAPCSAERQPAPRGEGWRAAEGPRGGREATERARTLRPAR